MESMTCMSYNVLPNAQENCGAAAIGRGQNIQLDFPMFSGIPVAPQSFSTNLNSECLQSSEAPPEPAVFLVTTEPEEYRLVNPYRTSKHYNVPCYLAPPLFSA